MPVTYLLTTSLGIADVVINEIQAKLQVEESAVEEGGSVEIEWKSLKIQAINGPQGLVSCVMLKVEGTDDHKNNSLMEVLVTMRSVHDILQYHGSLPVPQGENPPLQLYDILKKPDCDIDVTSLKTAAHFRVTCQRMGKHSFQSTDVEMEVGGALHERYSLPAKMKNFMVCVRVDVHINTVTVCTLLNEVPLSKRHKLAFVRTVTLKPNVAYAMLHMSGVKDGDMILDPFVGSGTILLESLEVFPNTKCWGLDRSMAAVKGSTKNAEAAGLNDRVKFVQGNARTLHKTYDFKFDKIISNFPWGLKTGATADIKELYKGSIASCWGALKPGGILTCIVLHDYVTVGLLRTSGGWDILHARVVKTGGKLPAIIVARKRPEGDQILPVLRNQRSNAYRYIQDHPLKDKEEKDEVEEEEEVEVEVEKK
eukprot:TRINITY_DN4636_c4_g1_i1.p1 TRINITY_DN4636_c4_g1~~TRINITY_DN4636_c4_g1_i1.p1  ORF type:complete len:445 (+),score=121.60 TRINITY_DN4636_c4_g1_i1:65-1336(+)